MDDKVVRRKRLAGLIMLAGGALVYLTGLWPACHSLSDKGYFCDNGDEWLSPVNTPGADGK